jgi:hypothetical protein
MRTSNRRSLLIALFAALSLLAIAWAARADESVVTPAMAGHWEGRAHVIVTWCQQTNLAVVLDIAPEGSVTGKIGDAALVNGRFKRNRGWLGRKLHMWTDYIIQGDLAGPVVAAEGITRSGVNVPLTFTNGMFKGTVHTTGWEVGGKEHMILTAPVRLARTNAPQSVAP